MSWSVTAIASAFLAPASAAPAQQVRSADPGFCVLTKAETLVRTLLRSEPGSPEERSTVHALEPTARVCGTIAGAAVDEAGTAFRGSIARAYFRKRLPGLWSGPNSNPNFSPNLFIVERGYDQAGAMQRPYRLAHCIVSVNFNGASRVSHAAAGTTAEAEALAELRPAFASCLDAGERFALRPEVLRDTVAVVLAQEISFPFDRSRRPR